MTETGRFGVAQHADEIYHALPVVDRTPDKMPTVDFRPLPGPNATAASAFLRGGIVLQKPEYTRIALRDRLPW